MSSAGWRSGSHSRRCWSSCCRAAGVAAATAPGGGAPMTQGRRDRSLRKDAGRRAPRASARARRQGVEDPFWVEVPTSKKAPAQVERARDGGAKLIFLWGGDGTVQRCLEPLSPARGGTRDPPCRDGEPARRELGIPGISAGGSDRAPRRAPEARCRPAQRRAICVMAGAGFDASMIPRRRGVEKGAPRPRGLRLDRRAEPAQKAVQSADRDRRGLVVSGARRAASSSGTSATSSRGARCSSPPARRRPARDRRRHRGRGIEWARTLARTATGQPGCTPRSSGRRAPRRSTSSSIARCATSSTGETG